MGEEYDTNHVWVIFWPGQRKLTDSAGEVRARWWVGGREGGNMAPTIGCTWMDTYSPLYHGSDLTGTESQRKGE